MDIHCSVKKNFIAFRYQLNLILPRVLEIPSKMFEIMAMARPIIGSIRGEAAEILKRSGGGLVVEPENPKAIAEAIFYLLRHPGKRQALGSSGRKFVNEYFSRQLLEI